MPGARGWFGGNTHTRRLLDFKVISHTFNSGNFIVEKQCKIQMNEFKEARKKL